MIIPFSRTTVFAALTMATLLFAPHSLRADHARKRNNPFLEVAVPSMPESDSRPTVARANELSDLFRVASSKVLPALVAIETRLDPGNFPAVARSNPFAPPSTQPAMGIGSGVIVDTSGVILTNNHVVANGKGQVTVRLSDGREFSAIEVLTSTDCGPLFSHRRMASSMATTKEMTTTTSHKNEPASKRWLPAGEGR